MALTTGGKESSYSLITCLVLAFTAVALRLVVRVRQRQALLATDYCIIASLAVFFGYAGAEFVAIYNPYGTPNLNELSDQVLANVYPVSIATETLFATVITLAKMSLLLFWHVIFISTGFRRRNYVVMAITIMWFITAFFVYMFQCSPPKAAWDSKALMGAKCIPLKKITAGLESTNIFVDILIIMIPINEIRKLEMSFLRKIGAGFVFALGGFVIVTGAVRIYIFYAQSYVVGGNEIDNCSHVFEWSNIQLGAAIICACLPTLPPLLKKRASPFEFKSNSGSGLVAPALRPRPSGGDSPSERSYNEYIGTAEKLAPIDTRATATSGSINGSRIMTEDEILITRDIRVERE